MYYIYHIEGIKVGCSINPKQRVRRQGYDSFSILEYVETLQEASIRELYWQKVFGYKIDNVEYHKTIKSPTKEGMIKAAEGFKKYWKNLPITNPEEYERRIRILNSSGGKVRGPIQGAKNKESGLISELGKKMSEINNRVQKCQFCGIESRGIGFSRWHGENCRKKLL